MRLSKIKLSDKMKKILYHFMWEDESMFRCTRLTFLTYHLIVKPLRVIGMIFLHSTALVCWDFLSQFNFFLNI